jgi:hypothetical protein
MDKMNANRPKANDEQFEWRTNWECERSAADDKYVPCGKPAAHVVEWRHQDGDRERRLLCREHAQAEENYWSAMDWDTGVDVSDVEDWILMVGFGGKTATRIGKNVPVTDRDTGEEVSGIANGPFPIAYFIRKTATPGCKSMTDGSNTGHSNSTGGHADF